MARSFLRLVFALSVVVGIAGGLVAAWQGQTRAQQAPTGQGVLIGQTGVTGTYGLAVPPTSPPIQCVFDASRPNVSITPPGLAAVQAKPQYAIQKVDVENRLYQRQSNGTFSLLNTVAGGSILAVNHELAAVPGTTASFSKPAGSDYVYAHHFIFYAPDFAKVEGTITVAYPTYRSTVTGSEQTFPDAPMCGRLAQSQPSPTSTPTRTPVPSATPTPSSIPTKTTTPMATPTNTPTAPATSTPKVTPTPTATPAPGVTPKVEVSALTGTVNSILNYTISGFPRNVSASITFDRTRIANVTTDGSGLSAGRFRIPSATVGPHTISWTTDTAKASVVFTVKSRIKVTPNVDVMRGQRVSVSLSGFARNEVVRIRWKFWGWFVTTARVTTNNTGSATVNVVVPWFVPDGPTSVRGDGPIARAQTNAVTISGGPS
jgi:hypothetical protein